jgi:2-oxo-4-hydroxy-4-carboxy-5-ureidoimidazoline decarboxylase
MAARRPVVDERSLLATSDEIWERLSEADWLEAFRSHPRIGESHSAAASTPGATAWSGEEQQNVGRATQEIKVALAEGNRNYEQRFQRIFLVSATGKSPEEILEILKRRLLNDEATEIEEAAEQQRQIAQLRLRKWLAT